MSTIRPVWGGRKDATVGDYVDWLLGFCPFRREQDRLNLVEGLAVAGLRSRQYSAASPHAGSAGDASQAHSNSKAAERTH